MMKARQIAFLVRSVRPWISSRDNMDQSGSGVLLLSCQLPKKAQACVLITNEASNWSCFLHSQGNWRDPFRCIQATVWHVWQKPCITIELRAATFCRGSGDKQGLACTVLAIGTKMPLSPNDRGGAPHGLHVLMELEASPLFQPQRQYASGRPQASEGAAWKWTNSTPHPSSLSPLRHLCGAFFPASADCIALFVEAVMFVSGSLLGLCESFSLSLSLSLCLSLGYRVLSSCAHHLSNLLAPWPEGFQSIFHNSHMDSCFDTTCHRAYTAAGRGRCPACGWS